MTDFEMSFSSSDHDAAQKVKGPPRCHHAITMIRRPPYTRNIMKRPNCCPGRSLFRFLLLLSVVLLAAFNEHFFGGISFYHDDNAVQLVGGRFRIHIDWHPMNRSDRFPSVQERVKLYMSNWYAPPCVQDEQVFRYHYTMHASNGTIHETWPTLTVYLNGTSKTFDSLVLPDEWFLMDARVMKDCARKQWQHLLRRRSRTHRVHNRRNMRPYCSDVMDLMDITTTLDRLHAKQESTPLLGYFGDGTGYDLPLPFFAKFRSAATREQLAAVTHNECINTTRLQLETVHQADKLKPIIWKLESSRHFGPLQRAHKLDTPWEEKHNRAFWSGDMTGRVAGNTDLDKCLSNQRCRFVLENAHSNLIDCGLTRHRLSSSIVNGTNVLTKSIGMDAIQKYKVIVSLEGNDVASGLKWSLLSASVVLMPPATQMSWAMEERLQPWVHYIPMSEDGRNAEDMVKWVLTHDLEARRIAERATLFMYDLVYHPDAAQDDRMVKEEIARRYRALWH